MNALDMSQFHRTVLANAIQDCFVIKAMEQDPGDLDCIPDCHRLPVLP